jgi:hypothetical protein
MYGTRTSTLSRKLSCIDDFFTGTPAVFCCRFLIELRKFNETSPVYLSSRPVRLSGIRSIVDNTLLECSANPEEEENQDMELSDLVGPAERNDATEFIRSSPNSQVPDVK